MTQEIEIIMNVVLENHMHIENDLEPFSVVKSNCTPTIQFAKWEILAKRLTILLKFYELNKVFVIIL